MHHLEILITSFAVFGLALSAVIAYLKVNRIWARKHIKEVAESVSVAAALLSLFTTVPFLLKFVVIDQDYVAAGKFVVSLLVFAVFFLVGIGFWVKREERLGVWRLLRRALASEGSELTYLLHSFAKPREAQAILRVLELVSVVDDELDDRERQILESVALPWGIHPEDIKRAADGIQSADIADVRQAFAEYLAMHPPGAQVEKVYDLVKFMVHADRHVSPEERLIMEEISGAASNYLADVGEEPDQFEVLVVPQRREHRAQIEALLDKPSLEPRAGGEAFVAGVFFSESFAQAICERFRRHRFFATVERREQAADDAASAN
jgi:rhodanese-related sulfurtransferase